MTGCPPTGIGRIIARNDAPADGLGASDQDIVEKSECVGDYLQWRELRMRKVATAEVPAAGDL